ncbi:deoxyribonuclease [Cellulomonas sp. WB94]|uniref:GmrSD restriction endonuclease domain-containing protein n=1 Tax=Cellulomonas sp. WB94 TaxID=2173174 RepID=UPI000D5861CD|nr:DUF1524 domain-containing protein [Cellulomonas sp. WB94]PVU82750.1 deoxyribonuclease [Cellulomonas sp. WB94]
MSAEDETQPRIVPRRSWLGPTRRRLGAGVLAGGLFISIVGSAVAGPADAPPRATASPTAPTSQTRTPTVTATSTPSPVVIPQPRSTPSATASVGTESPSQAAPGAAQRTATAALAELAIKGRAAKTGYSRDQFGQAWADVDRNGCDTRNDILRRDLTAATIKPGTHGCLVLSGMLADPYSGGSITFLRGEATSIAVQIDHVVALSDAWQKGAQDQTLEQRTALANDPLNLLAVDGPLNGQKGSGDAATWLPPNKAFRCQYVARQVAVKITYGLWVTSAEHDAIARILTACPDEVLPTGTAPQPTVGTSAAPAPAQAAEPAPAVVPTPPASAYFANCTAARAAGVAPLLLGESGYRSAMDGDDDGIACE